MNRRGEDGTSDTCTYQDQLAIFAANSNLFPRRYCSTNGKANSQAQHKAQHKAQHHINGHQTEAEPIGQSQRR